MMRLRTAAVIAVDAVIVVFVVFIGIAIWTRMPEEAKPIQPTDVVTADTTFPDQVQSFDLSVLDSCGVITNGQGNGSCVAIGPDLVLTARHCLGHSKSWVEIGGIRYEIIKEWVSEEYDVGLVQIDGILPYVEFGQMPNMLDTIYVVGSPLWNLHPTCVNNITKGIVSSLAIDWAKWTDGIIVDAAAYPGNSGGPLFDINGRLIGIMVGCHNRHPNGGDNFWLAEPVTHIKAALNRYNQDMCNTVIESEEHE